MIDSAGTDQERLAELVATAVADAVSRSRNNDVPKSWLEFTWKASMSFGIPVILLGVVALIFYQTFPSWVRANIETQQALTKNLGLQTANMEDQGKCVKSIGDNMDALSRDMSTFTKSVTSQHAQQTVEHKEIVSTLESISSKIQ